MRHNSPITLALCLGTSLTATAATHYVNNGSVAGNCPGQYSTIQAAINASAPNDTVVVCNGIYNEQVTIGQALTLNGQNGATIEPVNAQVNATDPTFGPTAAIVYVSNATSVTVSGLIIDGSQANVNNGCATQFYGIYYSGSSGTILHNALRYIEQPPALQGCQTGLPIYADNPGGAPRSITIQANSVHDFQKNGITVIGLGLTTTITGNYVAGSGPNSVIAQNGIQLGPDATGTISSNYVSNLIYSPCVSVSACGAATTGILIYDSVGDTVTGNSIDVTQGGVVPFSDEMDATLNTTVSSNKISNSQIFDGITFIGDGCKASGNTIVASAESAVDIFGNNNQVRNNVVIESPIGVLISSGTGSQVSAETNYDVNQLVVTEPPPPPALALPAKLQPFKRR